MYQSKSQSRPRSPRNAILALAGSLALIVASSAFGSEIEKFQLTHVTCYKSKTDKTTRDKTAEETYILTVDSRTESFTIEGQFLGLALGGQCTGRASGRFEKLDQNVKLNQLQTKADGQWPGYCSSTLALFSGEYSSVTQENIVTLMGEDRTRFCPNGSKKVALTLKKMN